MTTSPGNGDAAPAAPLCDFLSSLSLPLQIFTIFAFATTGGYVGSSRFSVICNKTESPVEAKFGYPFRYVPAPPPPPPRLPTDPRLLQVGLSGSTSGDLVNVIR